MVLWVGRAARKAVDRTTSTRCVMFVKSVRHVSTSRGEHGVHPPFDPILQKPHRAAAALLRTSTGLRYRSQRKGVRACTIGALLSAAFPLLRCIAWQWRSSGTIVQCAVVVSRDMQIARLRALLRKHRIPMKSA